MITSNYTASFAIGASSSSAITQNLTLSGNQTIDGIANVIISNNSSKDFTINQKHSTATNTLQIILGNATNNVIRVANSGNVTINAAIAGASPLSISATGSGRVTLNGTNTYTGTTTINAGTLQIGNGGTTGALSTSSTITNNATLVFNRSDTLTQGTNFSTAAITGTGSLIQNGSGNLTLNAANTYSGGTTLNSGTLVINNASAIGSGTLTINGGTLNNTSASAITLSTNNAQSWNGNFAYTGTNDLNLGTGAVAMNATRTVTVNGGNLTVGGSISGSGGLTKNGTGTLVLSGSNTYNGTTTINAGTVRAAATNALVNTGNITLNSVSSLLVTADGALGTNTGIELNGGTLAFGAGYNGTVGALTLSANSTIDFGTSNNGVLIRFNSIAGLANYNLSIWNWSGNTQWSGSPGGGTDQLLFTNASGLNGNLSRISFYSDLGQSLISSSGFAVGSSPMEIVGVPEPETYLTGILLLLGFTFYQLHLARHGQGPLSHLTFLRRGKC